MAGWDISAGQGVVGSGSGHLIWGVIGWRGCALPGGGCLRARGAWGRVDAPWAWPPRSGWAVASGQMAERMKAALNGTPLSGRGVRSCVSQAEPATPGKNAQNPCLSRLSAGRVQIGNLPRLPIMCSNLRLQARQGPLKYLLSLFIAMVYRKRRCWLTSCIRYLCLLAQGHRSGCCFVEADGQ